MNSLWAALFAETLKLKRSRAAWVSVLALCIGPLMGALFIVVLRSPSLMAENPALQAKAALTGFTPDWKGFLGLMPQVVGVGGVIVFGFVASWVFGREFSDRTAKDLFALPISRTIVVTAKLITIAVWCFVIAGCTLIVGLIVGASLGLGGWSGTLLALSMRTILITTALSVLLCPPVAFAASMGRGYLSPLGFVVFSLVIAQIVGALGMGAFCPWAVPGLYSGLAPAGRASLSVLSYGLLLATSVAGILATIAWWKYADQAR